MGAKQSKRSVDISGKEAEGGGEVAAAGAGGEGRVEPLADADALKPHLNGDAHIQPEPTEKEKELDSGTPENEKDATTEKEGKEENDKEKEVAPVTNGDAEEKVENGESSPAPEDGKKPKKEKIKKKWSLRSISFSRKDKPKQEKKQKDEELKTNGEPEKVVEEMAEAAAESRAEVAAEAESVSPAEGQTPSTPETEPLTNGAARDEPEEPAPLAVEAPAPAPAPTPAPIADAEPAPLPAPEQLPINGLSLEEPASDTPEEKIDESKPESPAAETVEIAPAPEIPAKEVCVQQMPLLESTPPPLPANPPPSSVASFAATTMAPELAPNTAPPEPVAALPDTDAIDDLPPPPTAECETAEPLSTFKESDDATPDAVEPEHHIKLDAEITGVPEPIVSEPDVPNEVEVAPVPLEISAVPAHEPSESLRLEETNEQPDETTDTTEIISERIIVDSPVTESSPEPKIECIPEPEVPCCDVNEAPLPPPPAQEDIEAEGAAAATNGDEEAAHLPAPPALPPQPELTNGVDQLTPDPDESHVTAENAKNKAKAALANRVEATAPASDTQEPVSVSDKLADLIPEVPDIPEINTETLQLETSSVALAN